MNTRESITFRPGSAARNVEVDTGRQRVLTHNTIEEMRAWAFLAPIAHTTRVDRAAVRLVLLMLIELAGVDGRTRSSFAEVADGIGGMTRPLVRDAFDVLEANGLIRRERSPQSIHWLIRPGSAA